MMGSSTREIWPEHWMLLGGNLPRPLFVSKAKQIRIRNFTTGNVWVLYDDTWEFRWRLATTWIMLFRKQRNVLPKDIPVREIQERLAVP